MQASLFKRLHFVNVWSNLSSIMFVNVNQEYIELWMSEGRGYFRTYMSKGDRHVTFLGWPERECFLNYLQYGSFLKQPVVGRIGNLAFPIIVYSSRKETCFVQGLHTMKKNNYYRFFQELNFYLHLIQKKILHLSETALLFCLMLL